MTVYADILFIVNLYIDALLLSAVRRFLHLPLSRVRWLLASLLGGVFGFTALLPQLRGVPLFLLGTAEAFLLVCAAFAPKRTVLLLKATFLLLLFGAALSGLLGLMQSFLPMRGMVLRNGTVYFDLSPLLLVLLTCAAYGILYLFDRIFRKKEPDTLFAAVTLSLNGKHAALTAKVDTGLTLHEPFSGLPAALTEKSAVLALLPEDFGKETCALPLRFVPYSSVGGSGVLPAFRPDTAQINGSRAELWVAVTDRPLSAGSFSALIGTELTDHFKKENGA